MEAITFTVSNIQISQVRIERMHAVTHHPSLARLLALLDDEKWKHVSLHPSYLNRHLNLEEFHMLTVPRSRQPKTGTQSVSNWSWKDRLLQREQQIWMINWVRCSSLFLLTPTDLWGNILLKSFTYAFFPTVHVHSLVRNETCGSVSNYTHTAPRRQGN